MVRIRVTIRGIVCWTTEPYFWNTILSLQLSMIAQPSIWLYDSLLLDFEMIVPIFLKLSSFTQLKSTIHFVLSK